MPCPHCGGEWAQKSRAAIFFVGLITLLAGIACLWFYTLFWIAAVLLFAISAYMIAWSTAGKGRWCRRCKRFFVS